MDWIAETHLIAKCPDSEPVRVILGVGRPRPHPEGDWVCAVQGEGLRLWEGPTELFGVGSWHSLMIGLRYLRMMLTAEAQQGAVFCHKDGQHEVSVDGLLLLEPVD